ncbi:MAG: hypothetical protein QMO91_03790 [Candidatus Tisiphia sp.]|nr:hypothetical protein [Candidatus Tisiphia sp.]
MKYFTFSGLALFFASMGSITTKPMPSTGLKKVNNSPKLAAPEYTSDIISQNFGNTAKYSVLESKLIEDAANAELPPYDPINIEKVEQTRSERAERSKRSLNTPVDGDDLNSLFESPENSNVVHHRGARAIETNAKYATLNNDNCFLTKISHTDYHGHPWDTFLTKCVGEPCDHINSNKEKNIPWSWKSWSAYNLFITEVTPLNDGEVRLGYQYRPSEGLYPSKNSVMHSEKLSCNEPLTPFYSHYKESTNLYQSKQFTEAMTEIELALQEEPNNQFAIDMNNLLRKLVETTTIEPTSSTSNEASSTATSTTPEKITETSLTSLITEASTTKENSSTAMPKDNTTQAESSTPTASQD